MSYPSYNGYGRRSHGDDRTLFVRDVTTCNQLKRKSIYSCMGTAAYRLWCRLQRLQFCFVSVCI